MLFTMRVSKNGVVFGLYLMLLLSACFVGCTGQVQLPSVEQLAEFENAGSFSPTIDVERLAKAKISGGPYRVAPGEVLELTMPAILSIVTSGEPRTADGTTLYICRISEGGTISLPVVGEIEVAGKSLTEIESAIIDAYYPQYAVTRPLVFARLLEYRMARVSITGAVRKPGVYSLRRDQMSLVALLMEAGGIVDEGAARIQIINSAEDLARNKQADASEKTARKSAKEAVEQFAKPSRDAEVPFLQHPSSDEIEVKLAFKQPSKQSPVGVLTVKQSERVLLAEKVDITNGIQRGIVLEKLVAREPHISPDHVEQRLCSLAELVKPSSGRQEIENVTTQATLTAEAEGSGHKLQQVETTGDGWDILKGVLDTIEQEERDKKRKANESVELDKTKPIVLPIKGLNIPFADFALSEGDTVVVEPVQMPLFTVIGLVEKPGNFPYPPNVHYNLMQALALAGGVDKNAEPRYASIYRLRPDGEIANVTLKFVERSKLTGAANTIIKPGDIIDVAHTPTTHTKVFLQRILNFNVGAYIPVFR